MSGHWHPIILTLGVLGVVLVVWLSNRMGLVDEEGMPVEIFGRVLPYWGWLGAEVVKSNIAVGKRVLAKDPGLSPRMVDVPDGQTSDLGRVLYGNSITLTPGTITLDTQNGTMRVHALTEEGAEDLRGGEMQRRTARVNGGGNA